MLTGKLRKAVAFLCFSIVHTALPTQAQTTFNADVSVGGNGGVSFRYVCPDGAFLVGLAGKTGAFVDHIRMVCARWNPNTRRLDDPFYDARQIGDSDGGTFREIRCNQGPISARDSAIGILKLTSTLRSDVPVPFVIDDTLKMECYTRDVPSVLVHIAQFGSGTDDGDRRRARGDSVCPGRNKARGLYGQRGLYIDRLGLVCGRYPPQ